MDNINNIAINNSSLIGKIWNHVILTVANNQIAVGNLIVAIILFFIGAKYYKSFLILINNKLVKSLNTDKDTLNILENLIYYILWFIFIITILQVANIPLSIFAFIGGAFAISLGLGAQNFINNLISSIIIMIERPIKIGDIVQIGNIFGTVKFIGIRNTIISSATDADILLPNTLLVNSTLKNWTLSNNIIKYKSLFNTNKLGANTPTQVKENIIKLQNILNNFDLLLQDMPKQVKLISINNKYFSYSIEFYCTIKNIEEFENIKNKLNLILINEFSHTNFFLSYINDSEYKVSYL